MFLETIRNKLISLGCHKTVATLLVFIGVTFLFILSAGGFIISLIGVIATLFKLKLFLFILYALILAISVVIAVATMYAVISWWEGCEYQ